MIHISVAKEEGFIREFSVEGHAGYDEAGYDIVCAAVSAVVQTAVLGLTDVIGLEPGYSQRDGFIKCVIPAGLTAEDAAAADTVLRTMLAGLRSIQIGYKDYISINEREVG